MMFTIIKKKPIRVTLNGSKTAFLTRKIDPGDSFQILVGQT